MAVREELLKEIIRYCVESAEMEEHELFVKALEKVFPIMEKFPSHVWCQVGNMMAEEGAYRMIEKMWGEYDERYTIPFNKPYATGRGFTLSQEV